MVVSLPVDQWSCSKGSLPDLYLDFWINVAHSTCKNRNSKWFGSSVKQVSLSRSGPGIPEVSTATPLSDRSLGLIWTARFRCWGPEVISARLNSDPLLKLTSTPSALSWSGVKSLTAFIPDSENAFDPTSIAGFDLMAILTLPPLDSDISFCLRSIVASCSWRLDEVLDVLEKNGWKSVFGELSVYRRPGPKMHLWAVVAWFVPFRTGELTILAHWVTLKGTIRSRDDCLLVICFLGGLESRRRETSSPEKCSGEVSKLQIKGFWQYSPRRTILPPDDDKV